MARGRGRTGRGEGVIAVLGPTNTGKTHLAVERMLGHASGMIGLPLRLLAREVYDRAVTIKGSRQVALITGEEKIVPARARYFVCTVESMPLERRVDFLAVDEIQLAADPERGHVFTNRLLGARGERETMLLGAGTMRRLIQSLLPEAEFISRPRFSELSYAGEKKLSRLPRRSAIVAFSAADVYALAELVRRQRGGAAVVLGALSPRTRNAQVALYQAGEVDYLVATDAIGMGLNMSVDHVAFAALRKFDGTAMRRLEAAELAQIAGRAGRHMNDGSFGTTAGIGAIEAETVEAVEQHRFPPVTRLQWRNGDLDQRSLDGLMRSLEAPSGDDRLVRAQPTSDYVALKALAADPEIARLAAGPAAIGRLWEVCRIPDFRKSLSENHHRLLSRVYRHLLSPDGVLPTDWVAEQVARIDRTDGDIDTLATRIAYVRTWTYISHRADWLADATHWQERARELEDKLSDALHAALTRRFVDRRTAVLMRRLKDRDTLFGAVTSEGEVLVEGQFVGRLKGLVFTPDAADPGSEGRAIRAAANRVLAREMGRRVARLAEAAAGEIAWKEDNRLWWEGAAVAKLAPGSDILRPAVVLAPIEHVSGPLRERVRRRLADWLDDEVGRLMRPLLDLGKAPLKGAARGITFQVAEALGCMPRADLEGLIEKLGRPERAELKRHGIRLGFLDVFVPAMTKPERVAAGARLWAVWHGIDRPQAPPSPGAVSGPADDAWPAGFAQVCGYRRIGGRVYRIDMLDRLAAQARGAARSGPFSPDPKMLSLLGCGHEDLDRVLRALGYRASGKGEERRYKFAGRRSKPRPEAKRKSRDASPFAVLGELGSKGGA
ncbi:MAG: helicase-related protein [Alphaproteobacteria bacterium]|jgi:ATP-dependent RNA helicase SUPV3L1/SUV3|nr:helicase-related protein [Alphaproteobacteria bacterium]